MATIQTKNLVSHSTYQDNKFTLVAEKLEEWEWLHRFLSHNPEIKEKYEVYKTYEILKK